MRSPRAVLTVLVLAAAAAPGAAHAAAPAVVGLTAFGHVKPGDPVADPRMGPGTVFPHSRAYYGIDYGSVVVVGRATGDVSPDGKLRLYVDITITDGTRSVSRPGVIVQSKDNPELGQPQGYFSTFLVVTELGVHRASGTPDSEDPAEWGPSTLRVIARARTPDGTVGPAFEPAPTIIKYAGVPKDRSPPAVFETRYPPDQWCHLSSEGMNVGTQNLGGTQEGACGRAAPAPDATWVGCVEPFPGANVNPVNDLPLTPCRARASMPEGFARVIGMADDLGDPTAKGVGSEIADVTIQALQGSDVIYQWKNLIRYGPRAGWSLSVNINDFEPNAFNSKGLYKFRVVVTDAWGHSVEDFSPGITVYPW